MDKRLLVRELERIVGKGYVIYHPHDLLLYEYDGSVDRALPSVVALPGSTQEVSQVVALAYREGLPIVARGAGTGLSGGAVTSEGGVQLPLTRMHRILEVDAENQLAVVEPGVVNADITKAVEKYGLYYVPDPSSQKACTIGGNVAENAGGPHCLRYGVTTNHVLGMEVVLEDGAMVWLGGRNRDLPGYDLPGTFVGGEGTLGIATKILIRLMRKPPVVKTYLAVFQELDTASAAVSGIMARGIIPAALEMMDALTIKAVESVRKMGYPTDAGAVLLIEVEGLREDVEEEGREVERICLELGAREIRASEEAEERERLWAGRKGALGALGVLAPNYYLVDGVVPRTRLVEVLRRVGEIGQEFNVVIANVFHAGDGNLHPCIVFDEREEGVTQRVLDAGGEILKVCVEVGGVLSGEHGIGIEKREYMPLLFTEDDLQAMRWLRDAFAPKGSLNPGKVFPSDEALQGEVRRAPIMAKLGSDAWI